MQALKSVDSEDLLILDTAGQLANATKALAQRVISRPANQPSSDDLHISGPGIPSLGEGRDTAREREAGLRLVRVLSIQEEKDGRSYLAGFGYTVLMGAIPEHLVTERR